MAARARFPAMFRRAGITLAAASTGRRLCRRDHFVELSAQSAFVGFADTPMLLTEMFAIVSLLRRMMPIASHDTPIFLSRLILIFTPRFALLHMRRTTAE